jgi:hypothetical protein
MTRGDLLIPPLLIGDDGGRPRAIAEISVLGTGPRY